MQSIGSWGPFTFAHWSNASNSGGIADVGKAVWNATPLALFTDANARGELFNFLMSDDAAVLAMIPVAPAAGFADDAVGVAGKITGYTRHGLNQAISRNAGRGVSAQTILNAVRNPTKVIPQAKGAMKYVGTQATVILNKAGKVITTWGKARGGP